MISLLYVSRAALVPGNEAYQMAEIVRVAQRRNLDLGVTGALTCMDHIFAQILEGPEAPVNQLMIAILRDPRHSDVRILELAPLAERRFPNWSMAFVPPSVAVRRHLQLLADPRAEAGSGDAARELTAYMALGAAASARLD